MAHFFRSLWKKSIFRWILLGVIILAICITIVVIVIVPSCKTWVKEKTASAEVDITGVSLKDISLTSAMVEVTVCAENPNPVGATLDRITYVIYFEEDGNWVKLGSADKEDDVAIKANGSTCFDIVNELQIISAIRALYEAYNQQGSVNLKIEGSAWVKVWPVSFEIPFERIEKVGL